MNEFGGQIFPAFVKWVYYFLLYRNIPKK